MSWTLCNFPLIASLSIQYEHPVHISSIEVEGLHLQMLHNNCCRIDNCQLEDSEFCIWVHGYMPLSHSLSSYDQKCLEIEGFQQSHFLKWLKWHFNCLVGVFNLYVLKQSLISVDIRPPCSHRSDSILSSEVLIPFPSTNTFGSIIISRIHATVE